MHKLRFIFTRRELGQLAWLFAAILVMAVLEVVGVASILPFMSLVARPEVVHENAWLRWAYEAFGFASPRSMLVASGVVVLVLITVANAFAAFTTWLQYTFAWNTAHAITTRLVRTYLAEPYEFFLHTNSSDLIKRALAEVNNLVNGVLLTTTDLVARTLVAMVIFALLLFVDASLALVVFGVLGGAYALLYVLRRTYLAELGQERLDANRQRFRTLYEMLSGIKAVQTLGAQRYFYDRFASASRRVTRVYPRFHLASQTPRYFVETLAFGGILTITLYLLAAERDMATVLPILSLYALAGYRLLPALQRVFAAAAQLRHSYPVIDEFYEDLRDARTDDPPALLPEPLPFADRITLEHVSFRYAGAHPATSQEEAAPVLRDLRVTIPKGASVAFVGSTGSGKTTLVDVVMGLLAPQQGQVCVDGVPLTGEAVARWQACIGYVPQDVFLYDETVTRNIAFGVPDEEIDPDRVREAARAAQAHDFVLRDLPSGYDTTLGERGVRLSGGQRQRLGLARALYRRPSVLLLDEATSALDGITEEAVVRSVLAFADGELTMILIAHRLSTVKHCDRIYLLDGGRIVEEGSFESLQASSPIFQRMVELTS